MDFKLFTETRETILLDGATGTFLIEKGLEMGECPELWNIEKADEIKQIANMYFEAGSDAVYTNSFGGSVLRLKDFGLEMKSYEINLAAAKIGVSSKRKNNFLMGTIGPSGKMLEPYGEIKREEMIESFSVQVRGLLDGGVDCFVLETFADINEIECAITAVKENSKLPFIASMTFNKTKNGYKTFMGVSVEEGIKKLDNLGAFAVGSNCGNGIELMIEIGREFRKVSDDIKILLKANAGEPKYSEGKYIYSEDAEFFKKHWEELLKINPKFIGGCCGTTPEHIRAFREMIDLR